MTTFPDGWPANCPQAALSEDANGTVFRIVDDPMTDDHFKTYHEMGKAGGTECTRRGVSVFRVSAHARHYMDKYQYLGTQIAHGSLRAEHGKTGIVTNPLNTHINWWPFADVERARLFQILVD